MRSLTSTLKRKFKFFYLFLSKKGLKKLFLRISNYGVSNEKDESNQKYIIMMNLISLASCSGLATTGMILLFSGEYFQSFLHFIGALVWASPIYINRNGLKLASRLIVIFYSAVVLLLCSCWFTHYSSLDNYFLIVAITCLFLFSPRERKWLLICITFCLALFVVESTPLQEYLPAYNMLTGEKLAMTNIILLGGQIMLIMLDVFSFVYVNSIRENNLLQKQQQLQDAQQKVQMQNEDLKTFSIAASHSMQTPLHVSIHFLKRLEKVDTVVENAQAKENIQLIQSGLLQIEQLVSGLFSYNRILNIENELSFFSPATEIKVIAKNIQPNYPNAEIIVPQSPVNLKTNLLLFEIIIQNLIDNGLKYNTSQEPKVEIFFKKHAKHVDIFVKDNGVGIPTKFIPLIFEPFKRIQSGSLVRPGNKLGLAGSKRAAERLKGNLSCISSNDYGSIFRLQLPL